MGHFSTYRIHCHMAKRCIEEQINELYGLDVSVRPMRMYVVYGMVLLAYRMHLISFDSFDAYKSILFSLGFADLKGCGL